MGSVVKPYFKCGLGNFESIQALADLKVTFQGDFEEIIMLMTCNNLGLNHNG